MSIINGSHLNREQFAADRFTSRFEREPGVSVETFLRQVPPEAGGRVTPRLPHLRVERGEVGSDHYGSGNPPLTLKEVATAVEQEAASDLREVDSLKTKQGLAALGAVASVTGVVVSGVVSVLFPPALLGMAAGVVAKTACERAARDIAFVVDDKVALIDAEREASRDLLHFDDLLSQAANRPLQYPEYSWEMNQAVYTRVPSEK